MFNTVKQLELRLSICIKYCINKHYVTGIYWSTLLNCRAHANIHIVVIRCIYKLCKLLLSHCCQFLLCLFRYWEESAQYIFAYSSKHRSITSGSFGWVWSAEWRYLLHLVCIQVAELQSCATAPHWSNHSIAGSYIRSYEIKRLLDNKNICRQFFIVD